MELDYWMFKNKVKKVDLAKRLDVHPQSIYFLCKKSKSPSLLHAIEIEMFTKGEVQMEELLSERDKKRLNKILETKDWEH